MSGGDGAVPVLTEGPLDGVRREVFFAQATELARAGRYQDAERILFEGSDDQALPAPWLDLLARLRAQQGRLSEAESYWARAIEIDPSTESYQAGQRRIAATLRRRRWSPATPVKAVLVLALAWVTMFLALEKQTADSSKELRDDLQETIAQEAATARTAQDRLSTQIDRLDQGLNGNGAGGGTATGGPDERLPLDVQLAVPGVAVRPSGRDAEVTFGPGLFGEGAVLNPEARAVLSTLATRLLPYADRARVTVTGHSDDLPLLPGSRFRDNGELSMARAAAVASYMRDAGLPPSMLSLSLPGTLPSPFPNDSAEGRARNRTASLLVTRR